MSSYVLLYIHVASPGNMFICKRFCLSGLFLSFFCKLSAFWRRRKRKRVGEGEGERERQREGGRESVCVIATNVHVCIPTISCINATNKSFM